MDVGAILSRSFNLYRMNLVLVLPHLIATLASLSLFVIFALSMALLLYWVLGSLTIAGLMELLYGPTPFLLIAYLIFGVIVILLISAVLGAYARAAVIGMVLEAEKTGKTNLNTGFKSAKKNGLKIFGYVIAVSLIPMMAIGMIVTVAVVAIAIASAGTGSDIGFGAMALIIFLLFLSLAAYVIIYVLAMFSPQKIVMGDCGIIEGIKASAAFVRKYPTETVIYIGVAFAAVVVTSILSMIFTIPRIIFQMMDSQFIAVTLQIFETLFSTVVSLLVAPYLEAVKTLLVIEGGKNEIETVVPAM